MFSRFGRAQGSVLPHRLTGAGRFASLHCSPMQPSWSFRFATLLAYATWAASAAKGKGSAGPVRRRRENETLGEIQRGLIRTGKYKMVDLIQNSMIE